MFEPRASMVTARSPFGLIARPSGESPTVTWSMTRGGLASRSITLTVSTLPSEPPPLPVSAVSASLPSGLIDDVVGKDPGRQVALVVGHLVAVDRQQRDLVGGRFDGERALAVGGDRDRGNLVGRRSDRHRIDDLNVLAVIDSTEIVPSARLATSARSPFGLIAMPEGCLPTVIVPITAGRACLQVDEEDLVVGRQLVAPSLDDRLHRVGDESDLARRGDREVGRRPDDRVHRAVSSRRSAAPPAWTCRLPKACRGRARATSACRSRPTLVFRHCRRSGFGRTPPTRRCR